VPAKRVSSAFIVSTFWPRSSLDFVDGFGGGIDRAHPAIGCAVFHFDCGVINFSGFVSNHDDVQAAVDDFFDVVRLQIDERNAARRGDHHFFAIGSEGIQIEIETFAVGFAGKLHDAMAGVGIDPFGGRVGLGEEAGFK